MKFSKLIFSMLFSSFSGLGVAQDNQFSVQDLVYEGALRIPVSSYGSSRMGFANGTFFVDPERKSFFVIGHTHHMAIAEFDMNSFSTSERLSELPMAKNLQAFTSLFDRVPSENFDKINHITGMKKIDGRIFVNAAQYYDGNADNTDTSFIIEDLDNLSGSEVRGFFKLESKVKGAGWITEIPQAMKSSLDGDYIFGFASNLPINGRSSMGPSAYSVRLGDIANFAAGDVIKTNELLSFSIANQLHPDHYNEKRENDLWTEVSNAYTGFIVPGTNTYAVFGNSGGHEHGIGYKITQDDGGHCGGACPYVASDVYNYYWLWNIDDLLKVKNGSLEPYEVRPYEYAALELPFENQAELNNPRVMIAAHYDSQNQNLYFMLGNADTLQSKYESAPILLKYSIATQRRPLAPSSITIQ